MSSEPLFDGESAETKTRLLSSIFDRLWRAEASSPFIGLLRAIDEAVVHHRCLARLERVHRMLERNYSTSLAR